MKRGSDPALRGGILLRNFGPFDASICDGQQIDKGKTLR